MMTNRKIMRNVRGHTEPGKVLMLLLSFILFSAKLLYADNDTTKLTLHNPYSIRLDTITVKTLLDNKSAEYWWDDKKMPWLFAGIISIVTVGLTVLVNHLNSKRNERVTLINVDKQITASTDIAIRQLDNSNKLAAKDFKATLNAKNRQEWINDTRHCISEYITECRMLNIELQNEVPSVEKIDKYFRVITYNYYKLLLLLKHEKQEHATVIDALNKLSGAMDIHVLNTRHHINDYDNASILQKQNELIKAGMTLLYNEWNKIQGMENN